jgi:type I restriction enzyme S subunit
VNVLPKGWVETTLGEVCRVEYGKGLSANQRIESGTVPVVGSAGVIGRHSASLVPGPVIVIGRKGNAGAIHLIRDACWPIDTTYFVCVPPPFDPAFLAYQLRDAQLRSLDSSTAVPSLRRPDLEACPLLVAPIREQERIVAAIEEQFSRLDTAEQLLRSARRRVDRMRAAALAAVTPADCKWTTLGEIAEIVGGVTKDSKRQSDPSFVEMPYLRVANVQRGYLDLREVTTIRVSPEKAKALRLEPGDILFNEGGDRDKLGRGWIWQGEIDDCIHQNHVFRARLLTNDADPKYVSLHGNTFGRQWFEKMGKQTTNLASINLKTLKSFPVPDLPAEEQHRIVAEVERRLTILESLSAAIDHALTRSDHLRRSILESAFTGELVPHVPDDEPAFELLARIASDHRKTTKPRRRQRA